MRRLSDVREDEAPVDFDMPPGDLDALLPDLPEAEEPAPHNPGTAPLSTSTHALHTTSQNYARICWRDVFRLVEDTLVSKVAGTVSPISSCASCSCRAVLLRLPIPMPQQRARVVSAPWKMHVLAYGVIQALQSLSSGCSEETSC